MSHTPHKSHRHGEEDSDPEPGELPVEPDSNAPQPAEPADHEHDGAPPPKP